MGYQREREYIKEKYGLKVETCHVAHVKAALGLVKKNSWNRIDPERRVKFCPEKRWPIVEEAVRHIRNV